MSTEEQSIAVYAAENMKLRAVAIELIACLSLSGVAAAIGSSNPLEHLHAMALIALGEKVKREHIASAACWCEPVTDFVNPENGMAVLVHKEIQ